jgi:hypothetical protein
MGLGNLQNEGDLKRWLETEVGDQLHRIARKPVPEAWHVVGESGEPAFQNGWTNEPGYHEAAFLRDPMGFVHIRGVVQSGTDNATIFTLPEGYRPNKFMYFAVLDSAGFSAIEVGDDGNVRPTTGASAGTFINVNLSFKADE